MIKPKTITEQMLFNTVRLETTTGSGTGFLFHFKIDDKQIPVIITNKHVVNYNEKETVKFSLHIKKDNNPNGKFDVQFNANWFFHEKHDLCFCFANPLFEQIKKSSGNDTFYIPTTEEIIWDNLKLEELSAMEDVVMVGYPNGLWDQKNNLPLFRKGVTASHPAIDFNREEVGVVDMACFPGSSGSPIFLLNENGYSDKNGTTYMGAKRMIFLGVLFQGPNLSAKGEVIVEDIPTQQKVSSVTPLMMNLGYYIKARVILDFKMKIQELIKKQTNE